jgi:hypothetical protein
MRKGIILFHYDLSIPTGFQSCFLGELKEASYNGLRYVSVSNTVQQCDVWILSIAVV